MLETQTSNYNTKSFPDKGLACLLFVFLLLSSFIASAQVAPIDQDLESNSSLKENVKKIKAEFTTSYVMRGATFKEGPDEAQFVQLLFNPQLKLKLSDQFNLTADATLSLNTSRVQTRFNDPSLNAINPNEVLFSYLPNKNFKLSVGAINQKHLDSPALIQSDLAFMGAIGSYSKSFKNLDLKIKSQYTIPSSVSLELDRTGNEETPSFVSTGIEADWKPKKWFNLSANVNYFSFSSDLPSIVAFNSGRMGNEVVGVNQSESSFAYNFSGISQVYSLGFDLNKKVSPFLTIKSVDNLDAPSERSRAQSIGFGAEINFKEFSITPNLAFFYAESDASPALYTDPRFGRNNRDGQVLGFDVNFKKLGFNMGIAYVNSDLIQERAVQNDLEYLEVQVGVANVKF